MPRPTKLTEEVADRIVAAIRHGTPFRFACEAAGVSYDTALRWLRLGRSATSDGWTPTPATRRRYEGFASAVERAQSEAVDIAVGHVTSAGHETWRASAWWLERVHGAEGFAKETNVNVRSAASLERELIDLLGPDKGVALILDARERVRNALGNAEGVAELPRAPDALGDA